MMLYRNTKVKVHSLDWDTDFFDIVAGVLQGDILALYLFIICLDYVFWTLIDLMRKMALLWQRQEANDTLHKQLQMRIMLRT